MKDFKDENVFQRIYEIVCLVPYGRVSTYGEIAKLVGLGRSARVVGWALKNCDITEIPAHRIVNCKGLLSGRHSFSPPELMQQLLEREGIIVVDNQVQEFKNKLFKFEI